MWCVLHTSILLWVAFLRSVIYNNRRNSKIQTKNLISTQDLKLLFHQRWNLHSETASIKFRLLDMGCLSVSTLWSNFWFYIFLVLLARNSFGVNLDSLVFTLNLYAESLPWKIRFEHTIRCNDYSRPLRFYGDYLVKNNRHHQFFTF